MKIAGVDIGPGHPCRVVAEISNNHNGDRELAHRLVESAAEAGADLVKFQAYTPEELVGLRGDGPAPDPWGADGWTMRRLYEKAQTPLAWFPELATFCGDVGVPWFASVFGLGSLTLMEAIGCPAYKLASLDYGSRKLHTMVKATGKPVIRSCSRPKRPTNADAALYCPPGYPQAPVGLSAPLRTYEGFSYHGTDPEVPVLAARLGARIIEVHVQLDNVPSELEAGVSLTISQLAEMVERIRTVEAWT